MVAADYLYDQEEYAILKENTIPKHRIHILKILASGQFGLVYKGNQNFLSSIQIPCKIILLKLLWN